MSEGVNYLRAALHLEARPIPGVSKNPRPELHRHAGSVGSFFWPFPF